MDNLPPGILWVLKKKSLTTTTFVKRKQILIFPFACPPWPGTESAICTLSDPHCLLQEAENTTTIWKNKKKNTHTQKLYFWNLTQSPIFSFPCGVHLMFLGTHLPFLKAFSMRFHHPLPPTANSHHSPWPHTHLPILRLNFSPSSVSPTFFFGSYQALSQFGLHHYSELNTLMFTLKSAQ